MKAPNPAEQEMVAYIVRCERHEKRCWRLAYFCLALAITQALIAAFFETEILWRMLNVILAGCSGLAFRSCEDAAKVYRENGHEMSGLLNELRSLE